MDNGFYVYCQFQRKQAEVYEFSREVFERIAGGDLDALLDAGVATNFHRVTCDDRGNFFEVWSKRQR